MTVDRDAQGCSQVSAWNFVLSVVHYHGPGSPLDRKIHTATAARQPVILSPADVHLRISKISEVGY